MHQKQFAHTRLFVTSGLFAALIFVVTAYLLHIPVPATGGYIHLGDAFLYLAASLLPTPYAVAAGGIGEALSDALTGSAVYAPFTLVIKALMALFFTAKAPRFLCRRNAVMTIPAGLVCVGGYYLTEIILLHSWTAPLAEIPANLVQAVASGVIYVALAASFDRAKLKHRLRFSAS